MRPIILEAICVDGDPSVIFWAAENGQTSLLQELEDTDERLHAAARDSGSPTDRFIDWNVIGRHPTGPMPRPFHQWDYIKRQSSSEILLSHSHVRPWTFDSLPVFCAPIHVAVLHGHLDIVRFLLERGAEIEAVSYGVGLPELSYGEIIPGFRSGSEFPPFTGPAIAVTPLVLATCIGDYETARWLLQRGASAQLRNSRSGNPLGATLLHLLSKLEETSETCRFVETLVRQGHVAVDAADRRGDTALARVAAMGGGESLLATLVALGADVNYVIPARGRTPPQSVLEKCIWAQLGIGEVGWWHRVPCVNLAPRLRAARRLIESGAVSSNRGWPRSMLRQCRALTSSPLYLERPDALEPLREFMAFLKAKFPVMSTEPVRFGFGGPVRAEDVS